VSSRGVQCAAAAAAAAAAVCIALHMAAARHAVHCCNCSTLFTSVSTPQPFLGTVAKLRKSDC